MRKWGKRKEEKRKIMIRIAWSRKHPEWIVVTRRKNKKRMRVIRRKLSTV